MPHGFLFKTSLTLLPACLPLHAALACSCVGTSVTGFIHHDATVLPANAVGVLFHARNEDALVPAAFSITADGSPVAARIEAVQLAESHPFRARLPRSGKLVRVIPAQAFRPGMRYSVHHRPADERLRARHPEMDFRIDSARFEPAAAALSLVLDGPAKSTVLPMEDRGGACSVPREVRAQAFRVQVAPAFQRYAPALSMAAEARPLADADHDGGAFSPVHYRDSLCTPPDFGRALSDRLVRSCGEAAGTVQLRSWVGMLEVGDDFVATAPVRVDLAAARPATCSGYRMLSEALTRGDGAEAGHLACALAGPITTQLGSLGEVGGPTSQQWLALARQPNAAAAACAHDALDELIRLSANITPALRASYLALSSEELRSAEAARVVAAAHRMARTQGLKHRNARDGVTGWDADMLAPLVPQLLALAGREEHVGDAAMRLIAAIGTPARAAAPALLDLVERSRVAEPAMHALAAVAPDDPAVHEALLRFAERADLGDSAALAFARHAGAKRPQDAVRLLLPLLRQQDASAVDALAALGPAAQSATPELLALAQRADGYVLQRVVTALLALGPDEAEVVAALVRAAAKVNVMPILASEAPAMLRFKKHAAGFAPVIDPLVDAAHTPQARMALRELIGVMRLAPAHQAILLERLNPCAQQVTLPAPAPAPCRR